MDLIDKFWQPGEIMPLQVLLVEDNPGDVLPTQEAFRKADPALHLHVVSDGAEALAFLRREGAHTYAPRPDLILLDLNLPKMHGLDLLAQIKQNLSLKTIPIAILTSSESPMDIASSYGMHVNCYLTKPAQFEEFRDLVTSISDFWLRRVRLPQ